MSNAKVSIQGLFDRFAATFLMGLGGIVAGATAFVGG